MGLIVNIPEPLSEVEPIVEEVSQNTIIRGTKEYNKDDSIAGAVAVPMTPLFPPWKEGGKVFYKVRKQALDPRNFKDSGDVGTLAVRYVVQPQGEKNTILRIDALFVEDFRKSVHQSDGSVESSEYKDIQDKLAAVELVKKETEDALEEKKARSAREKFAPTDAGAANTPASTAQPAWSSSNQDRIGEDEIGRKNKAATPTAPPRDTAIQETWTAVTSTSKTSILETATGKPRAAASLTSPTASASSYEQQPGESLEQHVTNLRRQAERLVKKPGAALQSAPFHTATTLKSLDPGAEVLVLITTSYWFGVETRDGEHGWIRRDQLEQLP